jgi:hypothetical protein
MLHLAWSIWEIATSKRKGVQFRKRGFSKEEFLAFSFSDN